MKTRLISILGMALLFTMLTAQKSMGQFNLTGKWTARCVIEKMNRETIAYCELCPKMLSEDHKRLMFEKFRMVFEKDNLTLVINGISTKVDYKFNEDFDSISFSFKKLSFTFKLLSVVGKNDLYILKNEDGAMLLLEKK
ncbi:MAG: hypothetical protein WCK34_00205 [Bacteroidota bacterium]